MRYDEPHNSGIRMSPLVPFLASALCVVLSACSAPPGRNREAAAIAGEQVVPLTTVEFSGHRYVVRADFGLARPVRLMVHGNARMFLALTHDVAEKLHGGPLAKVSDYGYSSRGKSVLDVTSMRLGGRLFSGLSRVPVFDFTETRDTLVQGMIGVRFLVEARAAVDFSRDVLVLGVGASRAPSEALLREGYKTTSFAIDAHDRVTIPVYFPAIGRSLPITPSTVSTSLTLHQPVFAGRVPMRKTASPDQSPNHTSPDEYVCDRVEFEMAGAKLASPASLEDLAEYAKTSEAQLESYGMLGFDWMKEHRAVLDYANRTLYFKP